MSKPPPADLGANTYNDTALEEKQKRSSTALMKPMTKLSSST
jgi:hypothetical protein